MTFFSKFVTNYEKILLENNIKYEVCIYIKCCDRCVHENDRRVNASDRWVQWELCAIKNTDYVSKKFNFLREQRKKWFCANFQKTIVFILKEIQRI